MGRRRSLALGLMAVLAAAGCGGSDTNSVDVVEIVVAAASELRPAFDEIGNLFTDETGVSVTFVYGSSGQLREQIINGAPFDMYASANSKFVEEVLESGRGQRESRRTFGYGNLALWTNGTVELPSSLGELVESRYRRIVIANPDFAPNGQAARDVLENADIWNVLSDRLIFADNIGDAYRIVKSGNADIGFIALSLVINEKSDYLKIPNDLHRPLDQTLVVMSSDAKGAVAQTFADFVMGETGREVLARYGYSLPDESTLQ